MPASPRALVMPLAAPISAAWPARVLAPPVRQAPTLKKNSDGERLACSVARSRMNGVLASRRPCRCTAMIGATRGSIASGRPIQKSSPSGPAISSRKNVPSDLPRGAPHHLADRPAEGEAVIAVARAGLPERLLVGQPRRSCSPIRRGRCPSPWRAAPARRPSGRASCAWSRAPCRCWPNSGQSSATGASRSSLPRLASTWAQSAVAPLVQEKTMLDRVLRPRRAGLRIGRCRPTGRRRSRRRPSGRPRRRPRRLASKFFSKASATRSKPGLQVPSVICVFPICGHRQLERLEQEARGVPTGRCR